MQIKDKDIKQTEDMDINFTPNIGFININFEYDELKTISLLGKNHKKIIDIESEVIRYDYGNFIINFHYEKEKYDYMSVNLGNIIFNEINFFNLCQDELIKVVNSYYKSNGIFFNYYYEETELDESFYFENIGLTVWFEGKSISDICIHNPIL